MYSYFKSRVVASQTKFWQRGILKYLILVTERDILLFNILFFWFLLSFIASYSLSSLLLFVSFYVTLKKGHVFLLSLKFYFFLFCFNVLFYFFLFYPWVMSMCLVPISLCSPLAQVSAAGAVWSNPLFSV